MDDYDPPEECKTTDCTDPVYRHGVCYDCWCAEEEENYDRKREERMMEDFGRYDFEG